MAIIGISAFAGLFTPLQIHSDFASAMQPLTALNVLSDTSSLGQIKEAIGEVAVKYLVDKSSLMQTIKCESNFKVKAKNKNSSAGGIAQFLDGTWKQWKCKGNKYNPKDALECMGWAFKHNLQDNWVCYKMYFSK